MINKFSLKKPNLEEQRLFSNMFTCITHEMVQKQIDLSCSGIYFFQTADLSEISGEIYNKLIILSKADNKHINHNDLVTFTPDILSKQMAKIIVEISGRHWKHFVDTYYDKHADGSAYTEKEIQDFMVNGIESRIIIGVKELSKSNIDKFGRTFCHETFGSAMKYIIDINNQPTKKLDQTMTNYIPDKQLTCKFPFLFCFGRLAVSNLQTLFLYINTVLGLICANDYSNLSEYFYSFLRIFFKLSKHGKITPRKYDNIIVTMGADPELEIVSRTEKNQPNFLEVRSASNFLSGGGGEPVGLDGCSSIAEIRPNPSANTTDVAINTKKLIRELYRKIGTKNVEAVASGGSIYSTGGHIHFGSMDLRKMNFEGQLKHFGKMLDSFLYYPIKKNMPGSTREWGKLIDKVECRKPGGDALDKFMKIAKDIKGDHETGTGYDIPSAFRPQNHGLEYRSLPSFICDFTFTRLVLKIAQGIARDFLLTYYNGTEYSYNEPPTKSDYLRFLTEKEYKVWLSYLHGHRNDRMLNSVFNNWGICRSKIIESLYINIGAGYFNKEKIVENLHKKYDRMLNEQGVHNVRFINLMNSTLHHTSIDYWGSVIIVDNLRSIGYPRKLDSFSDISIAAASGNILGLSSDIRRFQALNLSPQTIYMIDDSNVALSYLGVVFPRISTERVHNIHQLAAELVIEHLLLQYNRSTKVNTYRLELFLGLTGDNKLCYDSWENFLSRRLRKNIVISQKEADDMRIKLSNEKEMIYKNYCKWINEAVDGRNQ